jgi:hypothetical protein
VAQPFCQLWQEWVCGRAGSFCGEQLPPSPIFFCSDSSEPAFELLLEDSSGAPEMGWSGQSQVAGIDLGGGAPYLHVGDQLGRHGSTGPVRPAITFCGEADLVGQLGNQT